MMNKANDCPHYKSIYINREWYFGPIAFKLNTWGGECDCRGFYCGRCRLYKIYVEQYVKYLKEVFND